MLVFDGIGQTRLEVRANAGVELCLALWAAAAPEREPLSRVAVRLRETMPSGAQHALLELNENIPGWPLWMVSTFHRLGEPDLDAALDRLMCESPRQVALDILLGAACCPAPASMAGTDPLAMVMETGMIPPELKRTAKRLVAQPEVAALQLSEVLIAFADAGFRDLWQTQLEQLEAIRSELSRQLASDPWRALASLSPGVMMDPDRDRLTLIGGQDGGLVDCRRLDVLEIIPSVWLRRRVVLAHADRRAGLALGRGPALRGELHDERVPAMLAVLGDARRFEILRRCLEQPRTTSELASMLGITDGPVSRHLKALEHGGLIVGQRFGRHVRYAAVVEELHLLGQRLQRLPQTVWAARASGAATMAA